MPIFMQLPFFNKKNSAAKRDYLFALEIGYELVKSAVWTVANDRTQVLSLGVPVRCQTDNEDSLIPACDQTLSAAAANLDSTGRIQPEKMILGLPVAWVDADKIVPEKLHTLKNLTQKLSLTAIGFVVTIQALVRYLQFTESVPPTAIIVGFWDNLIEVTLVRMGKIEATQLVRKSRLISADVVEGLSRFGHVSLLPSRILIYNSGSDLENIKQELLGFAWQAPQYRLPFLHFPKVEVLPSDFSVKAISLAGGSEVALALGLISHAEPEPEDAPIPPEQVISPGDLGFVADVDIAAIENSVPPPEIPSETLLEALPETPQLPVEVKNRRLPSIKLPAFRFKLPSFKFSPPRLPASMGIIFGLLGLLVVAGGLFAAYWYLPRATVVITVVPKSLQHEFNLVADSAVSVPDSDRHILPAQALETTVTGHQAKSTSGTKTIGDKATGSVTVINGTPSPRTFPAGTVITSVAGPVFTFDNSVTVASASGTADPSLYQPGKAAVNITAQTIGPESNLTAGTQFRVGSFSTLDYVAKNEAAFSGGTSRQVAAVAAQDLTDLKSQLTVSLTADAKNKLVGLVTSGSELITESVKIASSSAKFDHVVGDVTESLALDLSVKASGLSFNSADLKNLITAQISSLIPPGFQQEENSTNHTFIITGVKDKQAAISVRVTAVLTPRMEDIQIMKNIAGKSVAAAKTYLESFPGVSQIDFKFIPSLPSGILTLPHVFTNIGVVIKTGN